MNETALPNAEARFGDASDFLALLFDPGDIVNFRCIEAGDGAPEQRWAVAGDSAEVEACLRWADGLNAQRNYSVYVGMNPRTRRGGGGNEAVAEFRVLAADLDGGVTVDEALLRVQQAELPEPSAIIVTGGGVHLYWRLGTPLTDATQWRAAQVFLIKKLSGDPVIKDPARVMRLPGFFNRKPGRDSVLARTYEVSSARRYALDRVVPQMWLSRALRAGFEDIRRDGSDQRGGRGVCDILREPVKEGHRHACLRDLALTFVFQFRDYDSDFGRDLIFDTVNLANQKQCIPPHEAAEVRHCVDSAISYRKKKEYVDGDVSAESIEGLREGFEEFRASQLVGDAAARSLGQGLAAHGLVKVLHPEYGFTEWMPGEWQLKILNSDPAEIELHVPAWRETACKGVIAMPLEDFLKPMKVKEAVFAQTLEVAITTSPQEWCRIWQGCSVTKTTDKSRRREFTGLGPKLVEFAQQIQTTGASKRFAAVAGLLLRHLSRSMEFEEGQTPQLQENGRGVWLDSESLYFRWSDAWAEISQTQRVEAREYCDLKRRLCVQMGVDDFRTQRRQVCGSKLLYTVFTSAWMTALEELACGGPDSVIEDNAVLNGGAETRCPAVQFDGNH